MKIKFFELGRVDSTNSWAKGAFGGLPDGALAVAAEQTAGRGRHGRSWVSPAGCNITATLVVKEVGEPFLAGAMCALAILELLEGAAPGAEPYVKWPNDVYVGDRKIAGILCESVEIAGGRVTGLVAGMGVNINLGAEELRKIDQPATSLRALTGADFDLKKLISALAISLDRYYIIYSNTPELLFAAWKRANRLIGRKLEFTLGSGKILTGVFADISPDGSIVLETAGQRRCFSSGEIRINRDTI